MCISTGLVSSTSFLCVQAICTRAGTHIRTQPDSMKFLEKSKIFSKNIHNFDVFENAKINSNIENPCG